MQINSGSFQSGWNIADRHLSTPSRNAEGLDQNEMANLAIHYVETGQGTRGAVLNTILAGGVNQVGYFDEMDALDGNRDGLVQLSAMDALFALDGQANDSNNPAGFQADFQLLNPNKFNPNGDPVATENKVRTIADDPYFNHLGTTEIDGVVATPDTIGDVLINLLNGMEIFFDPNNTERLPAPQNVQEAMGQLVNLVFQSFFNWVSDLLPGNA